MTAALPGPGPHGGDAPAIAAALGVPVDQLLDLSQSLNPFAPDPVAVVAGAAYAVARYPDPDPGERMLATAMGHDPDRVVITNGGSEAIALVAAEFPVARVDQPEFSLYQRHLSLDPGGPRWRSNPNNPLGTLAAADEESAVWDEAFWPMATGTWTRGDADRGSWVVGSLTKLLACPGLRIGYVIAPNTAAARRVRHRRPRWSVNGLALEALPALLEPVDLPLWRDQINAARADLVDLFRGLGLQVQSAAAPWVLIPGARHLRAPLAREGVVVRDCSSFGLDAIRVAVPHPRQVDRLGTAFTTALGPTQPPSQRQPQLSNPSPSSAPDPDTGLVWRDTWSPAEWPEGIEAVLFDIGDTLVNAASPDTAVADLQVNLRERVVTDLLALRDQGLRLGAVTDTAVMVESQVRSLLAPSGIDDLLEVLVTSVDVGAAKPEPTSLLEAIVRLGLRPHQVLYIGDRVIDRDAAAAAGCEFTFIGPTVAATIANWVSAGGANFDAAARAWRSRDEERDAMRRRAELAAQERLDALAKPPGSLGRIEHLAVRLSGIAGRCPPPRPHPVHVALFAADHGVHAEGVSAWPQEITTAMVATIASGRAAVSALARTVGAEVTVVDVGMVDVGMVDVGAPTPSGYRVIRRRVRAGTRNLAVEAAMSLAEATRALDVGAEMAAGLIDAGARLLVTGEMGIANTTAAAALIAAYTRGEVGDLVGRGAGADDASLARKRQAIEVALQRLAPDPDPLEVLAEVGGLEIAAMAGLMIAGAAEGVPVLVDGVIANAALLAAERLVPGVANMVIAGHRSTEPAAAAALDHLGLEPLLDLDMRLGEGTGAVLAVPLVEAASRLLTEVATIAEVTGGTARP